MALLPDSLRHVISLLAKLPGVGEKTAQRYALFLIAQGGELCSALGSELSALPSNIQPCTVCKGIAEVDADGEAICDICRDPKRDPKLICIVARVQDMIAVERSGAMRGRYIVLGKLLSPLDGIGPAQLPIDTLIARITEESIREVIVATPPSVDGEATALFLARELEPLSVTVSRIASGVPHGGDLEFADQITLGRALDGRRDFGR